MSEFTSLADLDDDSLDIPVPDPQPPVETKTEEPEPTPEEKIQEMPTATDEPEEETTEEVETPEATTEESTEEETGNYYDDVDALWGEALELDYGGVDPETPEGSFIREKAIANRAVERFDEYLKTNDPRAYAYALHRQNGGTDEEFLSSAKEELPDLERLRESVDLQERVYTRSLIEKGADPEEAEAVVKAAASAGKLADRAEKAWNGWKAQESDYLAKITEENDKKEATFRQDVSTFSDVLKKAIMNPEGNLQIPEAKKAEFMEHIKQMVKYDPETRTFRIVQEIDPKNLGKIIDKEFLGFTKGGLKDLVEKQAGVQVVKRLKAKAKESEGQKRSTSQQSSNDKDFISLGDL